MRTWRENNLLREKYDIDEPKLVKYRDFSKEMRALNHKYYNTIGSITISNISDGLEEGPIELGINWASIGTRSVEDVEEFVSDLKQAIKDCKNFKYNGYSIDWSKE